MRRAFELSGTRGGDRLRRDRAPTPAGGDRLVRELWRDVRRRLAVRPVADGLVLWLDRLTPVALREGVLHLSVRGADPARWVAERYGPSLEETVSETFGSPVRIHIESDATLGGALAALGLPVATPAVEPPPFVVRPETRLAQAAVQRLARESDPGFDQLLITGPPGVGKSLLLETFLAQRRRRSPQESWQARRGLELFREFAAACREGRRGVLRGELLAQDGLVLDDLHELSGKLRCQELVVDVLEYYRSRRRRVVLAAEAIAASPREFLPSLRSHLRSGMTVVVPQLAATSRIEILRARTARMKLPEWLTEELGKAAGIPLDEALGRCRRFAGLARRMRRPPSREDLRRWFPEIVPASPSPAPMDRILERCAELVGVPREDVVGGKRTRAAALGRHLAIYLALEVFHIQQATLRRWLGTLSPSVRSYVQRKITRLRAEDPRIDGFLREVAEEIGRGQRFLF